MSVNPSKNQLRSKFYILQIIVVDDGSKDGTAKAAFEFVRKHSLDLVRVIKLGRNQGKGAAVQRVRVWPLPLSNPLRKSLSFMSEFVLL